MAVQVTFYGLRADAAMGAAIFEVGYNSVLHLSHQEMKGQGARAMLDYRCAPPRAPSASALGCCGNPLGSQALGVPV